MSVSDTQELPPKTPDIHQDALDRAKRLDAKLSACATLEDRIAMIAATVTGRITFSTSLGIEDQAVTHAIASAGKGIDIFTLDTGRHFPETLDTLFETEARYGIKIRVMFPDAAEVEDLVAFLESLSPR